jgi:MFS family permease
MQGNTAEAWPRKSHAWWAVAILTVAFALAYIDRQILSLFVTPIKAHYGISDTAISLLQGLAFGLFYAILGIPLGSLADRNNRRTIVVVGIALWSVMTCLCGLAPSYGYLFLARMGVGVGEATLQPAALSLIADYFPPEQLPRVYSVYQMGAYVGLSLAYMLGGAVVHVVSAAPPIVLPWAGTLAAWQVTFVVVGAPGLIVAALLLTIVEPVRRQGVRDAAVPSSLVPRWIDVLRMLRANWRLYFPLCAAFTLLGLTGYALIAWTPTLFVRKFGWTTSDIGVTYGLILLVFASGSSLVGGVVNSQLFAKGRPDIAFTFAVWGLVILTPLGMVVPLAPTAGLALIALIFATILMTLQTGLAPATLQIATPNRMRAKVIALYALIQTIGGLALGPTCVALLTDFVFRDERALPKSLACLAAVATPFSALAMGYSGRVVRAGAIAENLRSTGNILPVAPATLASSISWTSSD